MDRIDRLRNRLSILQRHLADMTTDAGRRDVAKTILQVRRELRELELDRMLASIDGLQRGDTLRRVQQ